MRIRAKSALKPRGATSLPKMARNREIRPLAKANAPRSCTIKTEKRSGELKATSPTKIERIALAISQPRLFLVILEFSRRLSTRQTRIIVSAGVVVVLVPTSQGDSTELAEVLRRGQPRARAAPKRSDGGAVLVLGW